MTECNEAVEITADNLKMRIIEELDRLLPLCLSQSNSSAASCRPLHMSAVHLELQRSRSWIQNKYPKYARFFANGDDVKPKKIKPVLIESNDEWHADLFRMARLTWSLPYTRGYGRRLRFLIIDASNNKLMGILGLQSPPLDFPARDRLFSYPKDCKTEIINQTMDIYTLGAIPPYNQLLGGKLVALAATSNEIRQAYQRKYQGRETELNKRELPANLVALTTTSAFGRSSIYNRLKYHDKMVAKSIGFVEGYGTFHLTPVYALLREYLAQQGVPLQSGFGVGPRIMWQTCTRAFDRLGLPRSLLKHGVEREAFLFPLIENLGEYIEGRDSCLNYFNRPFTCLADWWHKRWLMSRAERIHSWCTWDSNEIYRYLMVEV